ncbi:MAG: DUF3800 domain-containing protein [Candidatus Magasanikbacteria bacterium]|nr:DUF3800 domain-containing protein [Candidatus Magasanikbacteria bacterium]
MRYHFFLDETGDHGLNYVDSNFPLFLLAGCLFSETELTRLEKEVYNFKREFFNTEKVILHSREIRKCEGSFQILFDLELKKTFYQKLNSIMLGADFIIIGAGVDKKEYVKKYGCNASNPYNIALAFIIERLIFCSDANSVEKIDIKIEKRGKKEDAQLLEQYNRIRDLGTYYVSTERFKNRIGKFEFSLKRDNHLGLQIADLCAYPLARHILNSEEPYIPFNIIKDKIYCDQKGEYKGYGLKIFP